MSGRTRDIDGVRLTPIADHRDPRGSFAEVFEEQRDAGIDPAQWSVVRSVPGALRGMHVHRRHDEYLSVVTGHLWVGLHDLRPGSVTEGASMLLELTEDQPASLTFPSGIVHGWIASVPTIHLQAVSEPYSIYGHDDNEGCRWDDPELGISWPEPPTVISARSEAFGSLTDLRATVRSPDRHAPRDVQPALRP